jgi:ABC-type multidrug transport system ATPase subunit
MTESVSDRPPAHIIWRKVTTKVKDKVILSDVTGDVLPGQFLAIMGPSGAGKTSLLNVLADKYLGKGIVKTEGTVLLNGRDVKELPYKFITAFVPQEDILIETLTVQETIEFSANLSLRLSSHEKKARVDTILQDLGLVGCKDNLIGGIFKRGVSGGEKKRASIGYELITDPSVLFLDEPTTGLDAYTALLLVQLLHKLASSQNRTVIATIHQPTSEIFIELDQLSLMSAGRTVYQGGAQESVEYFEKLGYPCNMNYNPSDHLMNVLCNDTDEFTEPLSTRIQTLSEKMRHKNNTESVVFLDVKPYPQASNLTKYRYLVWRTFVNYVRAPMLLKGKILKQILMGVIICATFWQLGNDEQSLQDRQGALFMCSMLLFMDSLFTNLNTFQFNKALFNREYSGRKYNTFTYYCTMLTVFVPLDMFFSFCFISGTYFIIGFNNHAENFFKFTGTISLLALTGLLYGNCVSILTPTIDISLILVQSVNLPMVSCAGLVVNVDDIPNWFIIKYISPFRYSFEALYKNEYDNLDMSSALRDQAVDRMNFPDSFNDAVTYLGAIAGSLMVLDAILLSWMNRHL